MKPDSMYLYDEESKVKYGKLQRKARFKEAMVEIENNVQINDEPQNTEPEEGELSPITEPEPVEEAESDLLYPV